VTVTPITTDTERTVTPVTSNPKRTVTPVTTNSSKADTHVAADSAVMTQDPPYPQRLIETRMTSQPKSDFLRELQNLHI